MRPPITMFAFFALGALGLIPLAAAQTCVASLGQPCSLLPNETIYTAVNAPNCTISGVQAFVSNLTGLDGANLTVDYAFNIDSNTTLEEFTTHVGASTFMTDIPQVCAFRVNGTNSEGASWGLGALLPNSFNGSIMMAAPDEGLSWGVASAGLKYAFATFASNSGHDTPDHVSGWETPSGLVDWSHRALHLSTLTAKAIINSWYNVQPINSYITGCGAGGRQVMKSIQTYPDDYNGAMAGAPTWWMTHQAFWDYKRTTYADAIPSSLYDVIGKEVLRQCDVQDGLTDEIISDPTGCFFDPTTLACSNNSTSDCLSPSQLSTLDQLYNDWTTFNREFVYPHEWLGSEADWNASFTSGTSWYIDNVLGFKNFTTADLTYQLIAAADALDPAHANADEFDLEPYFNKGGKFIHWHGMSDSVVSPGASIYYHDHAKYAALQKGIDIDDHYQLYLIPGLEHCTGTPAYMDAVWYLAGPYQAGNYFNFTPANVVPDLNHDSFVALIDWVEIDYTPQYLVTSNFNDTADPVDLKDNRRICAYPQQANWTRTGVSIHEDYWECVYLWNQTIIN